MILGALIDAGLPLVELKRALGTLGVEDWDISAEKVLKCGITATKFRVHEHARAVGSPRSTAHGPGSTVGSQRSTVDSPHPTAPEPASAVPSSHRHYHLAGIKKRIDQSALS